MTWSSDASGRWQVYVVVWDGARWTERAGSNSGLGVSASSADAVDPTIAIDAHDRPIGFWADHSSGSWEIYMRYWTGDTWQELSGSAHGGGISNSSAPSATPSAIVRGDQACVVWSEPDRDDREIRGRCLSLPPL